MKSKTLSPIEWNTLIGFAVALLVLMTIGAMSILFLNQAKTDDQAVEHSHDVIENLQACFLAEREMGTRAREFVLTGEASFLQLYQIEIRNFAASTQKVQELTVDNPLQQRRITTQLRPLIDKRLAIISRSITARQLAGQQAAIAILLQRDALALIDQIRQVINDMREEERALLQRRLDALAQSSRRLRQIIYLGSAAAILFVGMAWRQIHRDILARERIETNLRASEAHLQKQTHDLQTMNTELESFSYSVSHDLRAPLRGIEGFSELILANYRDRLDAQGKDYFERICAAAKRMGILIDEILNLSRITRSTLEIRPVDLTRLTKDIIEDVRKTEPARRALWQVQDSLKVQGDPALLNVVMTNLISNAWKFTGKTAEAVIEIGKILQEKETVYFVRDNGAGFDMAYQGKLFQAFQRLHTPQEFPGSGIGLATVQRVIRRHGGRVWAEGAVNHGATFYFTLP